MASNKFAILGGSTDEVHEAEADAASSDDDFNIETTTPEGNRLQSFIDDSGAALMARSVKYYTGLGLPTRLFSVAVTSTAKGDLLLLRTFNVFVAIKVRISDDDIQGFQERFARLIAATAAVGTVDFPVLKRTVEELRLEIFGEQKESDGEEVSISVPVVVRDRTTPFCIITDAMAEAIAAGASALARYVADKSTSGGKTLSFESGTFARLQNAGSVKSTLRANPSIDVLRCVQLALRQRLKEAVIQNMVGADLRARGRALQAEANEKRRLADTYLTVAVGAEHLGASAELGAAYEAGSLWMSRRHAARKGRESQANGGESRPQNARQTNSKRSERNERPAAAAAEAEY